MTPVDLEAVAADALRAQIAATLAGWTRPDLATLASVLALGTPSRLAAPVVAGGVYDYDERCETPHGVRGYTPATAPDDVDAARRLYRLCGSRP